MTAPLKQPESPWVVGAGHRHTYRAEPLEAARAALAGWTVRLDPDGCERLQNRTRAPLSRERGPKGRNLCRWCHTEVQGRRRNWCSDACVDAFTSLNDWGYCREKVRVRDRGICQHCKCDTTKAQQVWWSIYRALQRQHRQPIVIEPGSVYPSPSKTATLYRVLFRDAMVTTGWNPDITRSFWEADHIVARVDGGTDHPDNLRTLCVPCHKARTAKQAAHRAAKKRDKVKPMLKARLRTIARARRL